MTRLCRWTDSSGQVFCQAASAVGAGPGEEQEAVRRFEFEHEVAGWSWDEVNPGVGEAVAATWDCVERCLGNITLRLRRLCRTNCAQDVGDHDRATDLSR